MPRFALKNPFFVIMLCLVIAVVGVTTVARMPVDLFPQIKIPVVVVATFYAGMPPEQVEADITDTFERFFTLGSNIDHIESRSLTGVSLIKIYFKPGSDANAALSNIANLAMADLRRLPPGTLPPVVLKFDASSLPVCLVTLKGEGLDETRLKDLAQFQVRNQIANVSGASVPQPFGGRYRQIMVYVDPVKLEAHQLSLMDVVHAVNDSNLILPAGDVRIGPRDYNIYANAQLPNVEEINRIPLKTVGNASVMVADVGEAKDSGAIQTNIVRIDGQQSVYIPVLKQGGDSNTITIVNGIKAAIKDLLDIPKSLKTAVVFDQSIFVKSAIKNVMKEGGIGLLLTGIMILIFLGSPRATVAVLLSIPLSALVCFLLMNAMGGSINVMLLERFGAGFFPPDRRLGGRAGKHFSLHGNRRSSKSGRGKGRDGSLAGSAGGHVYHLDRVFPRNVVLWRQPLSFHRSRSGRSPVYLCLVHLCHDGGAALLRALPPSRGRGGGD